MSNVIFQSGAVWANTELSMINESLSAIGEAPYIEGTLVDTLPAGTDGEVAKRIVRSTMIEAQTRGWFFNLDYNFPIVPDINGFITLPPNVLKVDFGNSNFKHQYTLRNGRIYDYVNLTFKIDKTLSADITWLVDYEDLPPEAYEYIALRAARKFHQRVIGSQEVDVFTVRDEQDALINLQRLQMQSQDYNLQNSRVSTRIHNGYLVAGLYGNKGRRRF